MINGNLSCDERRYQISRFYAVPLDYIPQIAVTGVMLIAASVLVGRYQGILMLPAFMPGLTAMDAHVAIGLFFCATSLWLLQPKEITPLRRRVGQTMALFCLLPAFLSVADTLQLIPASGLDWLLPLFTLDSSDISDSPHRHVAFTMTGLALFLLGFNKKGLLSIIQWLAVLTLTIAIVILFGYLYSLTGYYSYPAISGIALPTALSLTFLTNGILFARPHEGIMRLITSAAAGGVIMRRLLPIVVVAPLMIGWLMLVGQRFGLVTPYFGLAMHEVMTTLLITVFIIHIAISLNREEKLRHCAEAGAKKHQSDLAHLVRINTMGEMVTSIAHELKQPLTAISLYSASCKEMLSVTHAPDQLSRQLDEIQVQSLRAAEIIRSTLEFARKKEPRAASLQLNELITEIKNFLEAEARNGDVQLVLELAPKLPTIEGDAIQLRQVLLNIIHNAIESMQAKVNKPKLVTVQTSLTADGEIRTTIVDNGPGMDAKTLSHIFESFFTTKGDAGIGMGLSISRSIIEAHGGLLWATSIPDQGSTFTFTLPREGLKAQGRG